MANSITAVLDEAQAMAYVTVTMDAPVAKVRIERVSAQGERFIIRGGNSVDLESGTVTLDDYEITMDTQFTYEATEVAPVADGIVVTTAPMVLLSHGHTWLKDPAVPSRNFRVDEVENLAQMSREAQAGVFAIIDRRHPVVVAATRHGWEGDFVFHTATLDQRTALLDLLSRGQILLLSVPDGYGIGNSYVHVSTVIEERVTGVGLEQTRKWTLPMTMVDRPVTLASTPLPLRWVDVIYNWSTWADLLADPDVPNWAALLQYPRP
jgi:hypothetical protein